MSDPSVETFRKLCEHARSVAVLTSTAETLAWDQQTKMPPQAAEYRAEQITALTGLIHQRRTAPQVGAWLGELLDSDLASDPQSDSGATIRLLQRDYERETKLPQRLVEELARTATLGQQAWSAARTNDDYNSFQPWLEKMFDLKRQQAAALGFPNEPYDALLDEYEPGALTCDVDQVLRELRNGLVPLVRDIMDSNRQAPAEILTRQYPIDRQQQFGEQVAAAIGFEFSRGRLDETDHPFCTSLGPHDCRLTTRYDERFFSSSFFSILHEAGHGLYEQGLRIDQFGLPPGEAVSLGVHESQSRLWENMVGRSAEFWHHWFPAARSAFSAALGGVTCEQFYWAVNDSRPSLIRVEADEATYNLHIVIRFELERELLSDQLTMADVPAAWADRYEQYLGIRPETDAQGVLQDVHWSAGLVGYFPTYALGNIYAAQMFHQARIQIGDLDQQIAEGDFQPLLDWLRQRVHRQGRCLEPRQLVERCTGKNVSTEPLIDYLKGKLGPLYGIT